MSKHFQRLDNLSGACHQFVPLLLYNQCVKVILVNIFNTDQNYYLKWDNEVVGIISKKGDVTFIKPELNEVVSLYTNGRSFWSCDELIDFLTERIISRDRRDIEKILFRLGMSHYDVLRITGVTRAIHPKDLLWIAAFESEKLESVMTDVFSSVFNNRIDLKGDSVDTPEGHNIKRYGVFNGKYGIYKQRINPLTTDVESEIAVYLLGKKLGVPVCPAARTGKDTMFSAFMFDFSKEYIVHFRRLFSGSRSDNEYKNLIGARPQYRDDIERMIILDFITRQDDRHLSNIAIKISGSYEQFYPLYDNGRSLFYEDTEEMVSNAVNDIRGYATSFGYSGTYWDYVQEIIKERGKINDLVNLKISHDEIKDILNESGFYGYRFEGALEWIIKAIELIRD